MVVKSLYTISLQKVFFLLEKGMWNSCGENPFSFYPTKVVEDSTTLAYSKAESVASFSLLFTSGRINYLNLRNVRWYLHKDLAAVLKILSEDACRNIRKLSVPKYLPSDAITLLEAVLRRCPNLEDVHSEKLFDLSALIGCKEMRYLRFHVESKEAFDFTSHTDFSVLRTLNNLKMFAFCDGSVQCFLNPKAVAEILLNNLKLISVGYVDTLMPLAHILNKESDPPPHFELRRCLWGYSEWDIRNLRYLNQYRSNYPEYIKNAVSFFPFVEELRLLVFHKECLQHLSKLQHLTFLSLDFLSLQFCDEGDFIYDLIYLLQKIGSQLRHIVINASKKISFDAVCDLCPNLESFHITNPSISERAEPSLCLKQLKRFSCVNINKETLMYFLPNCWDLSELYLSRAECLEDGILTNILKRNHLPKLKEILITKCSLSKYGLRLLLLNVPSLESVYISNKQREVIDLINELNLGIEQHALHASQSTFFSRKKYTCTF